MTFLSASAPRRYRFGAGPALFSLCLSLPAQQPPQFAPQQPQRTQQQLVQPAQQQLINPGPEPNTIRPDYVLGPNDQIFIRAPRVEEIDQRPFRIDADGFITLPLVGRIRAGGLTVQSLEPVVSQRLSEYVRDPQVFITVVQFRSEPVFVTGNFRAPGIYPLQGRTLVEMLTAVGGLQPNASRRIRITRRAEYGVIPLPNAISDPDKKISVVEISMRSLMEDVSPAEDIKLQPYDIISATGAERVYVSGEVTKPGPIDFGERDSISITQAVTEAGGLTNNARKAQVRVLRPILGTSRRAEIDIDLNRVLEGKDVDFPLQPNDVVYVARDTKRSVLTQAGSTFVGSIPYMIVSIAVAGLL